MTRFGDHLSMRFRRRHSEATIEAVLHGRAPADRDDLTEVSAFVASLRQVFADEPARAWAPVTRPIEARTLSRTRLAFAAAVGGATLAFGGFASAGALPDTMQREVARVADRLGLGFVPTPDTNEPAGDDTPAGEGDNSGPRHDPTGASDGDSGSSDDAGDPGAGDDESGTDDADTVDDGDSDDDGTGHSGPDDGDNSGPSDDHANDPSDDGDDAEHAEDPTDDPTDDGDDAEHSEPDDATDDSGPNDDHADEDPESPEDPDDNSGSGSSGSGSSGSGSSGSGDEEPIPA